MRCEVWNKSLMIALDISNFYDAVFLIFLAVSLTFHLTQITQ